VTAYTETVSAAALIPHLPPPGRIIATKTTPAVNVVEWKLSNGARVLVKPTDFKADEVRFGAYADGGTSLASDADFMSASLASQIVSLSGIGSFNLIDLRKKLTGKVASVNPNISETSEGLGGSASPQDLETLFQLIYLQFTAPRLDTAAYQAFKNQVAPFLANRSSDPDQVFADTVESTMSQHAFRSRPLTAATFAEVNPEKALAFYKDRYADAGEFTFVFVGNVDTTTLEPLVERYLASLPSSGRVEHFRDTGETPPKGIVEKVVHKGVEPKANTIVEFTGACQYAPEARLDLRAMLELFQIKLTESLRQQLGSTYSPAVGGACHRTPRQEYSVTVEYNSAPDNVDKLTKSLFALIDTLRTQPPSQADVDKVKEELLRSHEVDVKQNAYWLGNIMAREQSGEDISGLGSAYDDMIKALTPAQIQATAQKYLNTNNYARFVLLPEKS